MCYICMATFRVCMITQRRLYAIMSLDVHVNCCNVYMENPVFLLSALAIISRQHPDVDHRPTSILIVCEIDLQEVVHTVYMRSTHTVCQPSVHWGCYLHCSITVIRAQIDS